MGKSRSLSKSASSALAADFPEKLQCLFRPARYKILYGGRGAAKSWGIARALLIIGAERKLRIACGRETQRSIGDSVHHLLKSQIDALGLGAFYRVRDSHVEGVNGTLITYHGLKTNIASLKSIEGIDIFWAEEAQAISKTSWDVLIPTIRKDGSEIWVSFNPELDTDETYRRFVLSPPSKAMVIKLNWRDNPWFNAVLTQELEDCRARSEDDYLHIWEGNTKQVLDGAIFASEIRAAVAEGRFLRVPYDQAKPVETFWDLGRRDNTSIWFAQQVGFEFRIIDFYETRGKHISHYLKLLREKPYLYGDLWLPHDARNKNLGQDRTIEQQARDAGFQVRISPNSSVVEGINAFVTTLCACASPPQRPQPIPALAEQRICPKPPKAPAELLRRPVKKDFLAPFPSTTSSPAPPRPNSSTH
jgi:phage terminase large subunit